MNQTVQRADGHGKRSESRSVVEGRDHRTMTCLFPDEDMNEIPKFLDATKFLLDSRDIYARLAHEQVRNYWPRDQTRSSLDD